MSVNLSETLVVLDRERGTGNGEYVVWNTGKLLRKCIRECAGEGGYQHLRRHVIVEEKSM